MKRRVLPGVTQYAICSAAFLWFIILFTAIPAGAEFSLLDGDLILKGYVKNTTYIRTDMQKKDQRNHDSSIDLSKNSAYIMGQYKILDTPENSLHFIASFKYWYEMATRWDTQLRRSIDSDLLKNYQQPRRFEEDVLTEFYADYVHGPWDVRAGKQIVTWGELDVDRAADVVNPLDLRWGVPGVDAWEEVKRPMWLLRTTYQSNLPGNLLFENVINPGYFVSSLPLPPPGSHWSADHQDDNAFTKKGPGIASWVLDRWMKEAQHRKWNTKNFEIGFRVRGFTYNVDWTLLWWNAPDSGPVAKAKEITAFSAQYIYPALEDMILFNKNISHDQIPNVMSYKHDCYDWKRYNTFGGTAQTTFQDFMPSAVWRAEVAYTMNQAFNRGTGNSLSAVYDIKRQDALAVAMSWSDKWTVPWFTRTICRGKQLETTLTFYQQTIFNKPKDLVTNTYYIDKGKDDDTQQKVSFFMQAYMFNYSWVFTFIGSFQPSGDRWMACPALSYVFPGEHWRADVGWVGYGTNRTYLRGSYYDKDSAFARVRYEF